MQSAYVHRQLPSNSSELQATKREAILELMRTELPRLANSNPGQFVAFHSAGFVIVNTREEAEAQVAHHTPHAIVEIPTC